jgi:molybdopterin-containing oxidoreductase family molybdopterin binding subunit
MSDARSVRTVCDPNCHANPRCGITAHVEDGRIVKVEPGGFSLPEYDRRICAMGMARLEQQYHKDRLRYPLRRTGERGQGQWQRIAWDEAFDFLARRLRDLADQHGWRSLAFFAGSGAAGALTKGSAQRFAAAVGGTAQRAGGVDYGVPKGLEYMFGVPASTYFRPGGHEFADALNSRLILFWGANPADTRLVDFHFVTEAQRRGATLVCIDPNRSATAQQADLWISPRPGTDGALALSLLDEILRRGWHDAAFLQRHTNAPFLVRRDKGRFLRAREIWGDADGADYLVWDSLSQRPAAHGGCAAPPLSGNDRVTLADGASIECATVFELLRALAGNYPADRAEAITGVPAGIIRDLARQFAASKPAAIRIGYGVDRWYYSDYTARAVANLVVGTGNIGIPGGGISVHDGTYAAPLNLHPFRCPGGREAALLDIVSLMKAIEFGDPYPVKALWLSASNMFNQTAANRARVLSAVVPKLDLLVVVDHFMTDTAALADVVLPACTIFEKKDLVAGMFLQLQRPAVAPEGESKSDWDIFAGLAARMGLGKYFDAPREAYLREMIETDHPLLKGITLDRLEREDAVLLNRPPKPYVGFTDCKFKTPSARIELYKEDLLEHGAELPYYHEPIEASPENPRYARYPLALLFSHSRHRIHSTFANLSRFKRIEPEPTVEIHPEDAASRRIAEGQYARVYNERGSVCLRARLSAELKPGVVVISEGSWVRDFRAGDPYSLTHERVSPTSENYAFFDTLVEIEASDRLEK